jgi:hypothetical protein
LIRKKMAVIDAIEVNDMIDFTTEDHRWKGSGGSVA